jgi:hypothetical protein
VRRLLLVLAACSSPASHAVEMPDAAATPDAAVVQPDAPPLAPLLIHGLGIQGFWLQWGNEAVLTAPLYTRQDAVAITINAPITRDDAAIDTGLAGEPLDELVAVVSGHAHYDHFIDVPHILDVAPHARAYTNLTGRHILAALAPDRTGCTSAAAAPVIDRSRVVAMDDALASHVDYTNCPDQRPDGAPMNGTWLEVSPHVRLKAFCSMHPAQVGPYHFGAGAIDQDQCDLPAAASGWLEGQTLAFLIDFLDDQGNPAYRVFYQDAPTNAPSGHVPDATLADKAVDVALLCVGSADAVTDHPGSILANLAPRFVLSGHWEDFFQPVGSTAPIPLLDVTGYVQRAQVALPGTGDGLTVDGSPATSRHVLVQPDSRFVVSAGAMLGE